MITYRYLSDGTKVSAEAVLQPEIDEGARSYDPPLTARWTSVDPLAHKYLGMSPYNYCGGNPINYFDIKECENGQLTSFIMEQKEGTKIILERTEVETNHIRELI